MQSQELEFSLRLSGRHVTGSFESSFRVLREEDADVLRIRSGSLSPEPENKERWHKMSYETEKTCLLAPQESQTPCGCHKYEIPGMGEDSVLEMLSYSKFSDLETWLCMPSTMVPRSRDSVCSLPPPSHENGTGDTDKESRNLTFVLEEKNQDPAREDHGKAKAIPFLNPANYSGVTAEMKSLLFHRPLENESIHLSQCQERETHLLPVSASPQSSSPLWTTSTPLPKPTRDSCQGGMSVKKRRRLAASPGGLHWDASGSVLRDHERGETSSLLEVKRFPRCVDSQSHVPEPWSERVPLRKTISVDDRLLQQTPREHHRLLSRIERGKKKLRNIDVSGRDATYHCQIELSYKHYRKFHTGPSYKCALRCLFLAMSYLFTCTYSCV
ncbi:hypothetical protein cypCar_00017411 [Cyprinus carpio]|nr:hypothetical protein cypCar_00017411 [Cyprinus carpio]